MVVMLNNQLLSLKTVINDSPATCLLDSGATHNFLSADWCKANGLQFDSTEHFSVRLADGQEVSAVGKVKCFVDLGPMKTALTFHVLQCDIPCVLGIPFLQTVNPTIDWVNRKVQVCTVSGLSPLEVVSIDNQPQCELVTAKQFARGLRKGRYLYSVSLLQSEGQLNFTHRTAFGTTGGDEVYDTSLAQQTLEQIKSSYPSVFTEPQFPISREDQPLFEHRIPLKDPQQPPPRRRIYPLDPNELSALKQEIDKLLSSNRIWPSDSPYGAPILFAKKKDGGLRMCIDYRALNKNTITDSYPLPRIDEMLTRLKGARYFSRLDLRDGYHQLPMALQDVPKTAFSCRYGTFEYLVMPMGLTNAPSTFQRVMNHVFFDLLDDCVIVYLDDILIFSRTKEEHLTALNKVFSRLAQFKLVLKESKCSLFLKSVAFLGYVVSSEGISVQKGKIAAVQDWPQPKNLTELQQFLGLCNYYRRFIRSYAKIAAPLTDILRKHESFSFSTAQIEAFQLLKRALTQAPVLSIFDPILPRRVLADTSGFATGAILEQLVDSEWHPIEYFSKRLSDVESKWSATEREMLGCILALEKWRPYLVGKPFDIVTDHASLQFFTSQQKLNRRQTRWVESLADFEPTFVFRKGKFHLAPDALSRLPALNAAHGSNGLALQEAVRLAQSDSSDQEFNHFKQLAMTSSSDFQFTNGLVTKQFDTKSCLVIPGDANQLKQDILSELHTSPLGGHLGSRKLLAQVNTRFWWPHLKQSVQEFCRSCVLCQQTKVVTQKPLGLLLPLEPPSKPFEQVTMDLITHLPLSNGFDAVFTIVDRFSKYVTFVPCSTSSTALDLASLFYDHIVCKFGMPAKIVSDRDSRFLSMFWQSLMGLLQCKLALSSGYHPQTDGQSERFHRSLEQILRCYVTPNQLNWVQVLQQAAFALNSTVHAAHLQSPFKVIYGMEPTLPLDLALSGLSSNPVQAVDDFVRQRSSCFDVVKAALAKSNTQMAKYADKHRRDISLRVGDLVYVSTEHFPLARQLSRKLAPRWVGPFPISSIISRVAYHITLPEEYGRIHPVFHVSYLRPHMGPVPPCPPSPLPLDDSAAGEFEVEDILDSRLGRSGPEYLVKWLGYPVFEATWEPAAHLANAPDILNQFLSRRGRRSFRQGE